jgi:23S rRNA (cytosine1962-C5)-methyltransferase
MTATLILKPGKEKSLQRRHPWVYATAVARVTGNPGLGETVKVLSHEQRFLAWAAYSEQSLIRARAWSFAEGDVITADFIARRIAAAVGRRKGLASVSNALRIVFGEADELPGMVADQYGDTVVIQCMAAGIERWKAEIVTALVAATGCKTVVERSDAAVRGREGLPEIVGVLRGELQNPVEVTENGVRYTVDVLKGHKTGFYVDQRDNRALAAEIVASLLAQGKQPRVLNCFCYTGGFSLAALGAGAAQVVSVDSSAEALATGQAQAALNGFDAARSEWRCENVFDTLKALAAEGREFDLIVLDPPKFAPSANHVDKAARAYKEINLKGMKLLAPGGHLLTFSCSGAISVDLFQKIVAGSVIDARVDMQLLQRLAAGIDHPMAMTHPEGEYLKGLWLRRM